MPDRRKHRGKHPQDDELFAVDQLPRLRQAVADHSWLLTRGYATDSSLKLAGDRFNLTVRQRVAVQRCSCSDTSRDGREGKRYKEPLGPNLRLGIDGYNLLITVESALSGGVLLIGRDGCVRDLASIHGTYRHVEETIPALGLIMNYINSLQPARVDWYLDRPVSNSGRLKQLMTQLLEECSQPVDGGPAAVWNIELLDSPDRALIGYDGVAVSTDSVVLDGCQAWANVARNLIGQHIPRAWILDLCPTPD